VKIVELETSIHSDVWATPHHLSKNLPTAHLFFKWLLLDADTARRNCTWRLFTYALIKTVWIWNAQQFVVTVCQASKQL